MRITDRGKDTLKIIERERILQHVYGNYLFQILGILYLKIVSAIPGSSSIALSTYKGTRYFSSKHLKKVARKIPFIPPPDKAYILNVFCNI